MIRLSVNVNKVATLRNSRGGPQPDLIHATRVIVDAGCTGITVHPRADERHITRRDVYEVAAHLQPLRDQVEYNIEGDPRPDLLDMVEEVKPHQCTLVPVRPGEVTSEAGWDPRTSTQIVTEATARLKALGIRVSVFVDPREEAVRWASGVGADRIELYTEPYARAFERGDSAARTSFAAFSSAAQLAHELGLGINAGHDLDLDNLALFRDLPYLDEVSIGHALISRALFVGLDKVTREYLSALGV